MLPLPLKSEYLGYKKDTDAVAAWLASTAKKCGFPADQLKSGSWDTSDTSSLSTKSSSSGRKKGKARKAASAAVQATKKAIHGVSKYIVAISDYPKLAKHIADTADPAITVPDNFVVTINRVISNRSGFGERLAEHGVGPDTKGDLKHRHFVEVLKKVREALLPRMSSKASTSTKVKAAKSDEISNRFAGLAVEEPSQAFLDAPDVERPTQPTEDKTIYEAETLAELEDVLFTYTIMMNDLARIRATIRWIWENYQKGLFDIAAAAVATDTALALARGIIDEAEPSFKNFEGATWGVQHKFFLACCLRKGYNINSVFSDDASDNFNYNMYDLADECFINAHRCLLSFLDVLSPDHLPIIREGVLGHYDPTKNRDNLPGHAKFKEDQILLMEFLSELTVVTRMIPSYPVEDEFMRGVREMDKTSKIPLSLVFAAQTFLDIHHLLRVDVSQGSKFMQNEIKHLSQTLKDHLDYHKKSKLRIKNWPERMDDMLRLVIKQGQEIVADPVYQCKVSYYRRNKIPIASSMRPNRILDYSPVLAGLNLLSYRGDMYSIGFDAATAWGSIQYTTHLYSALQNEKLVDPHFWPDLEMAQALLPDSSFFPGGIAPKTRKKYLETFVLQMGAAGVPRGLKKGLPVSSIFVEKYLKRTEVPWTPENIHDIVSHIEKKRTLEAKGKKREEYLRPDELIQAAVMALHEEVTEMSFPWLTLHKSCWEVMKLVKEKNHQRLSQIFGSGYLNDKSQMPFVIGYIFMTTCGECPGHLRTMDLMEQAAEAVKDLLQRRLPEHISQWSFPSSLVSALMPLIEFEAEGKTEKGILMLKNIDVQDQKAHREARFVVGHRRQKPRSLSDSFGSIENPEPGTLHRWLRLYDVGR
ncbi:hypothetical protein NEUTE1DRAFT_131919 [Neurospora tetrasperma FGSC 2508]|uniref:DUF6604 domain-containing protein n=1 Tax=Neurospora tetrasperma (strain FGSC 2508 / ATCC MYA-4615 / P0657) TaxID=510951 RepID=F8MXB0_NEUT8|nr:uncharacterized protein NEUTE1DRAFT_131919 [Neurospora tetrasperma FGSC 2508]EGO54381.1 hypothetical protein NEUTE1DRAFT_131919 [Neurospora tetrasperma FGSC 2508]